MTREPGPYDLVRAESPEDLDVPPGSAISTTRIEDTWHYPEMPQGTRFRYPMAEHSNDQRVGRVGPIRFHSLREAKAFLEGVYWTKPFFFRLFDELYQGHAAAGGYAIAGMAWTRERAAQMIFNALGAEDNAIRAWLLEWADQEKSEQNGNAS